jgi:hypothetical protein
MRAPARGAAPGPPSARQDGSSVRSGGAAPPVQVMGMLDYSAVGRLAGFRREGLIASGTRGRQRDGARRPEPAARWLRPVLHPFADRRAGRAA